MCPYYNLNLLAYAKLNGGDPDHPIRSNVMRIRPGGKDYCLPKTGEVLPPSGGGYKALWGNVRGKLNSVRLKFFPHLTVSIRL